MTLFLVANFGFFQDTANYCYVNKMELNYNNEIYRFFNATKETMGSIFDSQKEYFHVSENYLILYLLSSRRYTNLLLQVSHCNGDV